MKTTVVIDAGSGVFKAGFAGEDKPRAVFSSIIGRWRKHKRFLMTATDKEYFIGDEAQYNRGILTLDYPFNCVVDSSIKNKWDDIEKIFCHTFENELRVAPEQHPVVLSEIPFNSSGNREKTAQIMFETFKVPELNFTMQQALALYASVGSTDINQCTGIVLDSGDVFTYAVPTFRGYPMRHAITRLKLAGRNLTEFLMRILSEIGYASFNTSSEIEIIRDMKEKICYVADDFEEELERAAKSNAQTKNYKFPDESIITVGDQCFRCPEALFQPYNQKFFSMDAVGIHEIICDSIAKCDIDIRKSLYENIVLSGGSTMFAGFTNRLQKEITAMVPSHKQINIVASPERQHLVWKGGSMWASPTSPAASKLQFITKKEYEEFGESYVNKKFY